MLRMHNTFEALFEEIDLAIKQYKLQITQQKSKEGDPEEKLFTYVEYFQYKTYGDKLKTTLQSYAQESSFISKKADQEKEGKARGTGNLNENKKQQANGANNNANISNTQILCEKHNRLRCACEKM